MSVTPRRTRTKTKSLRGAARRPPGSSAEALRFPAAL